jgi:hypothetical protein
MRTAITIAVMLALAAGPLFAAGEQSPPPTPAQEQPEVTPPVEHKGPVTTTPERKAPAQPAERAQKVTEPSQAKPEFVPPRQVHATRPERVKVPESSIVGRYSASEKGPPSRPANECQSRGESRDVSNRGEVKDAAGKGEDKQKKN